LKKRFCVAVAMISAALAAPARSQTTGSTAATAQGETPEIRVAAIVAPPITVEQNGSLTGFAVDLPKPCSAGQSRPSALTSEASSWAASMNPEFEAGTLPSGEVT
jgi:hypothetical protein